MFRDGLAEDALALLYSSIWDHILGFTIVNPRSCQYIIIIIIIIIIIVIIMLMSLKKNSEVEVSAKSK